MSPTDTTLPVSARVDDLVNLLHEAGPFATVMIDHQGEAAFNPDARELKWASVRTGLADAGCPDDVLDALGDAIMEEPDQFPAQCLIANANGVRVAGRHLEAPRLEFARWAPLPSLAPMIEWRQLTPPHVVAIVDRTGADIFFATPVGASAELNVAGEQDELRKVSAGGWSMRRYQQRAEDSWERNAAQVAERVAGLARGLEAHVVVVSGDPQSVGMLQEALPKAVADITHVVDGGDRHVGLESIGEAVLHLVATAAADETVAFLEAWREESGRKARAVEGAKKTIEALTQASVAMLGIHDDQSDDRTACFGPGPEHIGLDEGVLRDLGVDEPASARLHDAVIRAALLTGAGVRIIPAHGGPAEGIGGLLRWAV